MIKTGSDHKSQLQRLNRIEGQIRGIIKMVESQKYCIEILTQIKAARSALQSLEHKILETHLNGCVKKSISGSNKKESEKMINEIMELLKRATK